MKFEWVQDMDFMTNGGGAQLTDRTHFFEGVRRGHTINIITPDKVYLLDFATEGVIVSNSSMFPLELFQKCLELGTPLVIFSHDYTPICKYRLFYPMQESCKQCYLRERWLPVLKESKLIIWLSPLHRESWLWLYPELEEIPYHLSPSPVPTELFHDLELPRSGAIAVESLHPFKGREHVLRWIEENPEVRVTLIGGNPYPGDGLPPNCNYHEYIPYGGLNDLYNHHEFLLHLPQSPSPFDRTVVEAYLAGCRVLGNSNIGALSYPWFKSREDVIEHCRKSPTEFWEKVESVL